MLYKSSSSSASAGLAGAALLVILASCQIRNTPLFTETDGSYVRLPDKSIKAVVWGNNLDAVKSLKAWLLKQRFTLVDDVKINEIANDIHVPQPLSSADVLKVAKIAGIKQVIFVDANVSTSQATPIGSFLGRPSIYSASLFIRALNVESGEIDWEGKALSTQRFTNLSESIHQLTCHALATAWGLQKPGTATAPSICLPGQGVMVFTEPVTARYVLATAEVAPLVWTVSVSS